MPGSPLALAILGAWQLSRRKQPITSTLMTPFLVMEADPAIGVMWAALPQFQHVLVVTAALQVVHHVGEVERDTRHRFCGCYSGEVGCVAPPVVYLEPEGTAPEGEG